MVMLRRMLSGILSLIMVLMLPVQALAEEAAPELFVEETAEAAVFAPPVAGYVDEEDNDSVATANYIGLHLGTGCYGDLVAWDPDYYTFNTSAYGTGTFEIMVEVATFYENFTVALLDGNGNTLCYETDEEPYEGGYIIRFSKTVIGGTFYLSVSTMDSSEIGTSYAFTVTVKDGSFACTHPYADSKVTHPTCVDQGYTTYTCACGDSYVSDYVAGGHTLSSWKSDAAQHWLECTVCEAKMDTGNHEGTPCEICGYQAESTHDYQLGDVNHDGKINAKDATLILQKSVGVLKETAKFCETCAEVSGDGKLNAKDSTLILQFSVGLRSEFPAQQ